MLQVENLNVYYGAIHALQGISFNVNEGEIVTLIGANGAGKSTILRTLSGLLRSRTGSISFKGQDVSNMPAEKIVEAGISHVPEGRKIFAPLSVRENLMMGAYSRNDQAEIQQTLERAYQSFPRLKERAGQYGGTLSGGEQQMLATARGLMSKPTLMLLDEPSMGLSPILVEEIFRIIVEINKQGTSILLVEQNAQMALSIAHRAYVLETGQNRPGGPGKRDCQQPAGENGVPGSIALPHQDARPTARFSLACDPDCTVQLRLLRSAPPTPARISPRSVSTLIQRNGASLSAERVDRPSRYSFPANRIVTDASRTRPARKSPPRSSVTLSARCGVGMRLAEGISGGTER